MRLEFSLGQSKQYPLDLYFLLDYSVSMNASLTNVANQGGAIIDAIQAITKDVKIGVGSFTEKDLAPFSSSVPEFNCPAGVIKKSPCPNPYSYRHMSDIKEMSANEFKVNMRINCRYSALSVGDTSYLSRTPQ